MWPFLWRWGLIILLGVVVFYTPVILLNIDMSSILFMTCNFTFFFCISFWGARFTERKVEIVKLREIEKTASNTRNAIKQYSDIVDELGVNSYQASQVFDQYSSNPEFVKYANALDSFKEKFHKPELNN